MKSPVLAKELIHKAHVHAAHWFVEEQDAGSSPEFALAQSHHG
jgi:hypothetical protein